MNLAFQKGARIMSGTLTRHRTLVALLGAALGALACVTVSQTPTRDYGYPPQIDDIRQTVVRVAYFSGDVSYNRGDDPDDWQPAALNFPMTLGDRLYAARNSRVELQTENGSIYLAPETDFDVLNLTDDVKQFSVGIGTASFRIRRLDSDESFEVDTPNSAVTFDRPGEYRIDVDDDGNTRVIVNRGYAYVAAAGGEVALEAGRLMAINGIDSPDYDVMALPRGDSWDLWVNSRSRRFIDSDASRYVSPGVFGADDLTDYGDWSDVPGYGTCWSPANVPGDWAPYRDGRWTWQDPWGWTWVSNEPWGWAPYHYGRWVNSRSRWYWVPVGPEVRTVAYAPALVAFVGGPGFSLSVSVGGGGRRNGGGLVGWFPLAPRDTLVPWWGPRARDTYQQDRPNITYVNRTYVTVVEQNTFVSGAPVGNHVVRDANTVRDASRAPVVRGPIQIVPVASSIRPPTERGGSSPRPPAATLNRPVVTRLAPPPAPPLFRDKESVIRQNGGAPVAPADASRIPANTRAGRPTRSVVAEGGRVALVPKNAQDAGPAPVPVTRVPPPGQSRRNQAPERPPQDAAAARQQQQAAEALRQQQADAARKQQQAEEARRQQQADEARKPQQETRPAGNPPRDVGADTRNRGGRGPARINTETFVGTVTAYQAGRRIEILTGGNRRQTIDLRGKDVQVSVVGSIAVGTQVQVVREKGDQGTRVSVTVMK